MQTLTRDNLMSLEQYAKARPAFRAEVMAHKRDRQVAIGPNATLYFEDRLTIQYQVQEMLRIERVYAIADEDLERATDDKTSSVHFLRFELTPEMVAAVKYGAGIGMGIEHAAYTHTVPAVADNVRQSLAADLSDRLVQPVLIGRRYA